MFGQTVLVGFGWIFGSRHLSMFGSQAILVGVWTGRILMLPLPLNAWNYWKGKGARRASDLDFPHKGIGQALSEANISEPNEKPRTDEPWPARWRVPMLHFEGTHLPDSAVSSRTQHSLISKTSSWR